MNGHLYKVSKLILCNFLLIYTLNRVFQLFVGIDLHALQVFHLILGLYGIQYMIRKSLKSFDLWVITYIFYLLLNGLFIDYQNHWSYFYRTLPTAIASIFFYFIGRYSRISTINILKGMKWPWVVLSIIGIYCFFMLPSWYTQMKVSQIVAENVEEHVRGIYRLSSIWGHPYQITYATFLFGVFLIASLAENKKQDMRQTLWLLLFLCVIVLLLGQIRVAIFSLILSALVLFIIKGKENMLKKGGAVFLLFGIITVIMNIISTVDVGGFKYMMEHMFSLTEETSLSNRLENTSGGITQYTLFGNGYGRYGFEAREHDLFAIVDSEYQKHLAEVGYLGFFLLLVLLILTVLKSLKDKNYSEDFCILLFYCLAMIGASVLSNTSQYGFMFWFCMGKIWASKSSLLRYEN